MGGLGDLSGVVFRIAPNQCEYLVERVEEYLKELDFDCDASQCNQTVLQITNAVARARHLLEHCSSDSDWLWYAVLKQEHKTMFRMLLQELSQSFYFLKLKMAVNRGEIDPTSKQDAWQWPASHREELKRRAKLDKQALRQAIDELRNAPNDAHSQELAHYVHNLLQHEQSQNGEGLPRYLFRSPDKVVLERRIGEGAYGSVYEAQWLGRHVAAKVYAVQDNTFDREVPALLTLRHPNVVRLIGYTQRVRDGPFTLVMEKMKRDLQNLIRDRIEADHCPPFELDVAIDIILQIARGMAFLHANDVCHRDLKTANILINVPDETCSFYTAKISDFGLAETKLVNAQTKLPVRRAGTIKFMAPEIWEEVNISRKKADVYGFAMTCYEILTGKSPFQGSTWPADLFFMRVKDHNLRPELPAELPRCLSLLLECCWHGKPEIRPTFEEICNYLVVLKNVLNIEGSAVPDECFLGSSIGDILNHEKQRAELKTRDHHEAILAELESLQNKDRGTLAGHGDYHAYSQKLQEIVAAVKEHKSMRLKLAQNADIVDEQNTTKTGKLCCCFKW